MHLASSPRHSCSEKPSKIFVALWTPLEVAVARPEHQTTSILFIFGLSSNKMVVFVVVACTSCSVINRDGVTGSAKQLDLWLVLRLLRMMHGICVTTAWFFLFACKFFLVSFVVDPTFVAGDLGHEFAQSA